MDFSTFIRGLGRGAATVGRGAMRGVVGFDDRDVRGAINSRRARRMREAAAGRAREGIARTEAEEASEALPPGMDEMEGPRPVLDPMGGGGADVENAMQIMGRSRIPESELPPGLRDFGTSRGPQEPAPGSILAESRRLRGSLSGQVSPPSLSPRRLLPDGFTPETAPGISAPRPTFQESMDAPRGGRIRRNPDDIMFSQGLEDDTVGPSSQESTRQMVGTALDLGAAYGVGRLASLAGGRALQAFRGVRNPPGVSAPVRRDMGSLSSRVPVGPGRTPPGAPINPPTRQDSLQEAFKRANIRPMEGVSRTVTGVRRGM